MSSASEETPRPGPACDQCNVRKIKCRVGQSVDTCLACQHSSFRCTRLKVHKRRGPKRTKTMAFERDSGESYQAVRATTSSVGRDDQRDQLNTSTTTTKYPAPSFNDASVAAFLDGLHVNNPPPPAESSTPWHGDFPARSPLASQSRPLPTSQYSQALSNPFEAADSSAYELGWTSQDDTLDTQSIFNNWGVPNPQSDDVYNTLSFFSWAQNVNADVLNNMNHSIAGAGGSDFGINIFGSPFDQVIPSATMSASAFTLPNDMTANQCCDVYFDLFRPWCPVLSRQTLKDAFRQALLSSDSASLDLADSIAVLVETRSASNAPPTIGPRLQRFLERWNRPVRADEITVVKVMTSLHLFLIWEVLGEGVSAWLQFHQVVTLAELLGVTDWRNRPVPSPSTFADEDSLRLFYTLFIIERAHAVLQHTTKQRPMPLLRLPDDAYGATAAFRALLPSDALEDFPMDHLRLFSLVRSAHMPCWGDTCSVLCDIWTVKKADKFQQDLGMEMELSIARLDRPSTGLDVRRTVNLIISIAWFRDRFWNVCLRHKLITNTGPSGLHYRFILDNLERLIGVLSGISPADFGVGLDYGAKLSAMAITAISILDMARSPPGESPDLNLGRDLESLRRNMSGWVYKIIGLLSARPKEHDAMLKSLVQALAPVI